MDGYRITLTSFPDKQRYAYIRPVGARTLLMPTGTYPVDHYMQTEYTLYPGLYLVINYAWSKTEAKKQSISILVDQDCKARKFSSKGAMVFAWLDVDTRKISISGPNQRRAIASRQLNELFFGYADKWLYIDKLRPNLLRLFSHFESISPLQANHLIRQISNPDGRLAGIISTIETEMFSEEERINRVHF